MKLKERTKESPPKKIYLDGGLMVHCYHHQVMSTVDPKIPVVPVQAYTEHHWRKLEIPLGDNVVMRTIYAWCEVKRVLYVLRDYENRLEVS